MFTSSPPILYLSFIFNLHYGKILFFFFSDTLTVIFEKGLESRGRQHNRNAGHFHPFRSPLVLGPFAATARWPGPPAPNTQNALSSDFTQVPTPLTPI